MGRDRVERGERRIPVQVGVDRHQPVEGRGQEPRECLRSYGLARLEASVLSHVAKVGRDQRHLARAKRAGGVRGEREGHALTLRGVGMVGVDRPRCLAGEEPGTVDERWVRTLRRKMDVAAALTGDARREWVT